MNIDHSSLLKFLPSETVAQASRHALMLSESIDRDSWSRLVSGLVNMTGKMSGGKDTLTAWLGDVLAYGQDKNYRGQITEYAHAAGLNPGTLRDAKLVCLRIPPSCRHDTLSWSHHVEIGKAFKNVEEIKRWIKIAVEERLSRNELRQRIRDYLADLSKAEGSTEKLAGAIDPFTLLRELRASGRQIEAHSSIWKRWTPETRHLALSEVQALADFVDYLRSNPALPMAS